MSFCLNISEGEEGASAGEYWRGQPSGHSVQFPVFPRRETEASSREVPSHRPPRGGVAESGGPGALTFQAVLMVQGLFRALGGGEWSLS